MSRLREKTTAMLLLAIFMISVITVAQSFAEDDDIYIDEYKAIFYPDGTLVEEFTYTIRTQSYRMLFRLWDAPLSIDPLGQPYVELVDIEAADTGFWYIEDSLGTVYVDEAYPGSSNHKQEIRDLAYSNEAGSYNPNNYQPGTYMTRYTFRLHPPLEYDDDDAHLNLMLARDHMAYKNVTLVFEDADYIDKFYPHPPYLNVSREGGRIIVSGSSGEDELLEVEMVMSLSALSTINGFPQRVEDVKLKTMIANIETYESLEEKYNSLLLNFTKLQEDLDEANLEISSLNERIISLEKEVSGGIPGFPIQSLVLSIILVSVLMGLMKKSN